MVLTFEQIERLLATEARLKRIEEKLDQLIADHSFFNPPGRGHVLGPVTEYPPYPLTPLEDNEWDDVAEPWSTTTLGGK